MNAPRDPWTDFAEVFAEELAAPMNADALEAMREQYEREQIETARSEAWQQEMSK